MPVFLPTKVGNTPLIKNQPLNKFLNLPNLFLKLEQENPNGSHKDRSLKHQIPTLKSKTGIFAISSTGNAAISANTYLLNNKLKLITFISPNISTTKLKKLKKIASNLFFTKKPYRLLSYLKHKYKIPSLNAILDDNSITAYQEIGYEIFKKQPNCANIFVFISSGSTFLGIAKAFLNLKKEQKIAGLPKLFAVKLTKTKLHGVYPSAINLNKKYNSKVFETRKQKILKTINLFKGESINISDSEILRGRRILKNFLQDTSPEGCANFAAVIKKASALKNQITVCLLTGKANQWDNKNQKTKNKLENSPACNTIADLDEIVRKLQK